MADNIIKKIIGEIQFLELKWFGSLCFLPCGNRSSQLSQPLSGIGVGFEDVVQVAVFEKSIKCRRPDSNMAP